LVDAGMLIMASGHDGNPLDFEALERWTRVGVRAGDAVPQRRTITGECGYAPAQGKEGPTQLPGVSAQSQPAARS